MPFNLRKFFQSLSTAWKNRRAIVRVLQGIKIVVESDRAISVTRAIPGTLDDRALDILKIYLPPVIRAIGLLPSADEKYNDEHTALNAAIQELKRMNDKKAVGQRLNEIGAQVYIRTQNGKDRDKASLLIDETYQEMKAKGELV